MNAYLADVLWFATLLAILVLLHVLERRQP